MIFKCGASYAVSVYEPDTRRMRRVGTYPTEQAAVAAEAAAKAEHDHPERRGDYLERWLACHPRPSTKTNETYAAALVRVRAEFGPRGLLSVSADELRAWAKTQPAYVASTLQVLFRDAIADGAHPGPSPFARFLPPRPAGRLAGRLSEEEVYRAAESAVETWASTACGCSLRASSSPPTRTSPCRSSAGFSRAIYAATESRWYVAGLRSSVASPTRSPMPSGRILRVTHAPWMFQIPAGRQFTPATLYYYWVRVRVAFGRPSMRFCDLRLRGGPRTGP